MIPATSIRFWLSLAALVVFGYHWFALQFSPLPWFDETYFASMTLHFMESGEFNPSVSPLMEHYYPQAKAYGPLYFLWMSGVFKIFGFGIVQMRFSALLFGFLFILVGNQILKISGFPRRSRLFFALLVGFDPIFLQNIHSGRMDSFALFWVANGIGALLLAIRKENGFLFGLVGLCFGLALLSTPRISVSVMGPCLWVALYFFQKPGWNRFWHAFTVAVGIVALYSIWIFWGFGGLVPWWNYFFGPPPEKLFFENLADAYVRTRLYFPTFQYPLLAVFLSLVLFSVFKGKISRKPIFWVAILNVFWFYYLVNDTGIYGILALPFVYMVLLAIDLEFPNYQIRFNWVISFLVLINLGIFAGKNLVVLNAIPYRNPTEVQRQIGQIIPAGSKVIGDDAYYYAVMKSGSDFQYIDRGADTPRRRKYHFEKYDFHYLVVNDPLHDKKQFDYYNEWGKFKEVGRITMPEPYFDLARFIPEMGNLSQNGYNGIVYRRCKE